MAWMINSETAANLDVDGTGTASLEQATKRRGVTSAKDEEIMRTIARQTLLLSQQVRQISACVFKTVNIQSDSVLARNLANTGKAYHTATVGRKDHNQGPPFVHLYVCMVKTMIEKEKGTYIYKMDNKDREQLTVHYQELEKGGAKGATQMIKFMKTKVCHDRKTVNVMIVPDAQSINAVAIIIKALVSAGATVREGPAPSGGMERAIQTFVGASTPSV
jgi:hypothetical protein